MGMITLNVEYGVNNFHTDNWVLKSILQDFNVAVVGDVSFNSTVQSKVGGTTSSNIADWKGAVRSQIISNVQITST